MMILGVKDYIECSILIVTNAPISQSVRQRHGELGDMNKEQL